MLIFNKINKYSQFCNRCPFLRLPKRYSELTTHHNMFYNWEWTLIWKRELNTVLLFILVSCDISQYDFGQSIPDNTFLHLWVRGILFAVQLCCFRPRPSIIYGLKITIYYSPQIIKSWQPSNNISSQRNILTDPSFQPFAWKFDTLAGPNSTPGSCTKVAPQGQEHRCVKRVFATFCLQDCYTCLHLVYFNWRLYLSKLSAILVYLNQSHVTEQVFSDMYYTTLSTNSMVHNSTL
jgi:hypothetical protein